MDKNSAPAATGASTARPAANIQRKTGGRQMSIQSELPFDESMPTDDRRVQQSKSKRGPVLLCRTTCMMCEKTNVAVMSGWRMQAHGPRNNRCPGTGGNESEFLIRQIWDVPWYKDEEAAEIVRRSRGLI